MIDFKKTNRRISVRESRIAKLLASAIPVPWRHLWRRRALEIEENRKRLKPLPNDPRFKLNDAEWEVRILALKGNAPTCLDRRELDLKDDSPTVCLRTGLVLVRGRCPDCPCKSTKGSK